MILWNVNKIEYMLLDEYVICINILVLPIPSVTFYVVTYFISLGRKYYFWYFCLNQKVLYLNIITCKV